MPPRRAVLAAALLPLAGCSGGGPGRSEDASPSPRSSRPSPTPAFAALERAHGARLRVYALATGSGATLTHRADERFAFCSTFKALAVGAVLDRHPTEHLEDRVTYTREEVNSLSPVTRRHVDEGMTVRQLCDAAIRHSDGTAGNLLMRDVGGPRGLTSYLRGLGDRASRMDRYEPELNRGGPRDTRDTTTPRAVAGCYRALLLGDTLPTAQRALLRGWLLRNTTGDQRIRAGVPKGWKVADKTGTGNYGRAHDVGLLWPPDDEPLVLAVLTDRPDQDAAPREALIAEVTRQVVAALT
ncbi:class A beta-lactamase [Streptomyces sp. NPDC005438]|uniref:class A beta-lactamase n=1 Tax=Streptomyces sp. NPDC005438 TaxID=3156880 RepID=UPI0033AB7752